MNTLIAFQNSTPNDILDIVSEDCSKYAIKRFWFDDNHNHKLIFPPLFPASALNVLKSLAPQLPSQKTAADILMQRGVLSGLKFKWRKKNSGLSARKVVNMMINFSPKQF